MHGRDEERGRVRQGRPFGALRHRDFRLLWCSAVGFHISNWMQQVGQSWLLYDLTHSAVLVSLNGLLRTIPFLLMSLYAGSIVDRVDRRKLLIVVESSLCGMTLFLGLLVLSGAIQVWHIYAFSIITAFFGAFEIPAQQALLPHTVPREDLLTAVALNSMLRRGTQIIGPSLGGVFIAAFGVAGSYLLNCVGYLGFIVALVFMHATNPVAERIKDSPMRAAAEGLKYVASEPLIGALLLLESMFSVFGSFNPLLVVIARDVFQVGPQGFGVLQSAAGIGALLGTAGLSIFGDVHHKGRLMIAAGVLYCVAVVGFAYCPWFPLAVCLLALSGVADFVRGTTLTTTLQLFARGPMLGRVMSLQGMSTRGLGQMGGFQAGAMSNWLGIPGALTFGATVCLIGVMTAATRVPAVRNLVGTPGEMSTA